MGAAQELAVTELAHALLAQVDKLSTQILALEPTPTPTPAPTPTPKPCASRRRSWRLRPSRA